MSWLTALFDRKQLVSLYTSLSSYSLEIFLKGLLELMWWSLVSRVWDSELKTRTQDSELGLKTWTQNLDSGLELRTWTQDLDLGFRLRTWTQDLDSGLKTWDSDSEIGLRTHTSLRCCGELAARWSQYQWGDSAVLSAPESHPGNQRWTEHHVSLSQEHKHHHDAPNQSTQHVTQHHVVSDVRIGACLSVSPPHRRWSPWARFSWRSRGTRSGPTACVDLRSWVWCWSGLPADSPLRRWCSNLMLCEDCSPKSDTHTQRKWGQRSQLKPFLSQSVCMKLIQGQ